jgi:hypothetical protein
MKTLKFTPELCDKILSGEKTATWRLFDDKSLEVGDHINFVAKETGQLFGDGTILKLKVTTFENLVPDDWVGHETYTSAEEIYTTYRGYYGSDVSRASELKIVTFDFVKNKSFRKIYLVV